MKMRNCAPAQCRPMPVPKAKANRRGRDAVRVGWREWVARGLLVVLSPLVLLAGVEGVLRIFGYGYPVTFFLRPSPGGDYLTNERFAWRFFSKSTDLKPLSAWLPARKAPGTIRLCILGGSAAMGTPDPAFSFGRILGVELRREFPARRFEVLNAAMRGIDSDVVRVIARECARHQVDCFIVYMGNNDVIGLHGPNPGSPGWTQSLALIRCMDWFRGTRVGELFESMLEAVSPKAPKQDMNYFRAHSLRADDWRRDRNREDFRANLEDIVEAGLHAGAKVILATLGANLKDFPPLESLHRRNLPAQDKARWDRAYQRGSQLAADGLFRDALVSYRKAEAIDDHFADLHFRMAQCCLARGDVVRARKHYSLARDWDAMQFRTDTPMNDVIREVAARYQGRGVFLVDAEKAFARGALCDSGIPGRRLFIDHVHPTFAGYYVLASAIYGRLVSALAPVLGAPAPGRIPTRQECAEALAYTRFDEVNVIAAATRLTAGPPFLDQLDHAQRQAAAEAASQKALAEFNLPEAEQCLEEYREALRRRPDDWLLHYNFAVLCQSLHLFPETAAQFRFVAKEFPQIERFRLLLAAAQQRINEPPLVPAGDLTGSKSQFEANDRN
jgi:tetratricopeptide (TPR) repeat protein